MAGVGLEFPPHTGPFDSLVRSHSTKSNLWSQCEMGKIPLNQKCLLSNQKGGGPDSRARRRAGPGPRRSLERHGGQPSLDHYSASFSRETHSSRRCQGSGRPTFPEKAGGDLLRAYCVLGTVLSASMWTLPATPRGRCCCCQHLTDEEIETLRG